PLYLAAGIVGYWGAVRLAAQIGLPGAVTRALQPICSFLLHLLHSFRRSVRSFAYAIVQRARIAAIRHREPRFGRWLLPRSRLLEADISMAARRAVAPARPGTRFAAVVGGLLAVAIIPAGVADFAEYHSAPYANHWNEPWPNEPEVVAFFKSNVGRAVGQPIRGSVHFWTYNADIGFTIITLWANAFHPIDESSQLVTPQALYALHALLQNNVTGMLNGFVPFAGTSWDMFFKPLQLFGTRYYVTDPAGA